MNFCHSKCKRISLHSQSKCDFFCDFQTLCNLVKCIKLPRNKIYFCLPDLYLNTSLVDKILVFLECWIVIFVTVFHGKLDEDFGLLLRAIKSLNQMANLESWHMSSSSQQRGKKIVGGFGINANTLIWEPRIFRKRHSFFLLGLWRRYSSSSLQIIGWIKLDFLHNVQCIVLDVSIDDLSCIEYVIQRTFHVFCTKICA